MSTLALVLSIPEDQWSLVTKRRLFGSSGYNSHLGVALAVRTSDRYIAYVWWKFQTKQEEARFLQENIHPALANRSIVEAVTKQIVIGNDPNITPNVFNPTECWWKQFTDQMVNNAEIKLNHSMSVDGLSYRDCDSLYASQYKSQPDFVLSLPHDSHTASRKILSTTMRRVEVRGEGPSDTVPSTIGQHCVER